jgi:histidine ammonia-lyase
VQHLRKKIPALDHDRYLADDIELAAGIIRSEDFIKPTGFAGPELSTP